jgi:hypothetical protein
MIMLQAVLRRKLTRPEEDMEDLLTSNTFGLMRYLPAPAALLPFLHGAVNPLTGTRLGDLLVGITRADRWRFWPYLSHADCIPCEPDIELSCSGEDHDRIFLLIEAKFHSGKSSFSGNEIRPNDQLAREYDNATHAARSEGIVRSAVVYVTADIICPEDEVRESAAEYRAKRGCEPEIYWTSWRFLPAILCSGELAENEIARDLHALLLSMELTTYCRLRSTAVASPKWSFKPAERLWHWSLPSLTWCFDRGTTADKARRSQGGDWQHMVPKLPWQFMSPEHVKGITEEARLVRQSPFRMEIAHRPDAIYRWRQS